MARISGIELADNWRVDYALTRIKGIGWPLSKRILDFLKIDRAKRIKNLTSEEVAKIGSKLEEYTIEGDLIRKVKSDIARLQVTGTYRGMRHSRNLPSRGQRTKTNARTKRGKRKTIGAFKKEALGKIKVAKQAEEQKK